MKVIAEYGQTMGGSIAVALDQVDAAAAAGATAYKTQLLTPETIAQPGAAIYWSHGPDVKDQREAFERAGLIDHEDWLPVADRCAERGLDFVASAFDLDAVAAIDALGGTIKIASGDITHQPLIAAAAATDRPLIVSTGAATKDETHAALYSTIAARNSKDFAPDWITFLACSLVYPTPTEQAQIGRIAALRHTLPIGVNVGYSDHTSDPDVALTAAAAGATVLEVHCTLNPDGDDCADHAMSLTPDRLADYVDAAKRGEQIRGDGQLGCTEAEEPARLGARRSCCAKTVLDAGHTITAGDIVWLRPGDGIAPSDTARLIGGRLTAPIAAGEPFDRTTIVVAS